MFVRYLRYPYHLISIELLNKQYQIFSNIWFNKQKENIVLTAAVTLSQSEINAWNPAPNTDPAVLQQALYSHVQ